MPATFLRQCDHTLGNSYPQQLPFFVDLCSWWYVGWPESSLCSGIHWGYSPHVPSHLPLSQALLFPCCHTHQGRQRGHLHSVELGCCTWWLIFAFTLYILVEAGSTWFRHYSQPTSLPAPPRAAGYPMWQNFSSSNTSMRSPLSEELSKCFFFKSCQSPCSLSLTLVLAE